jgi:alkyl hydroperoxide reductase subunit AhpC
MSVDPVAAQRVWTASMGVTYPVLSDFHPKGQVSAAYGLYNEERGVSRRAVVIVDKEGIIRFRKIYDQTTGIPDAKDILVELQKAVPSTAG